MTAATLTIKRPPFFKSITFMLIDAAIVLGIAGFIIGGALVSKEVLEVSRMHAQISQLAGFDNAVATFYEKFDGLPGDLISVAAEREGLAYGDGTPGHGDGDGKISPCNLGWQWNLGCETALFWSHLSAVGFIPENFSADGRITDYRVPNVTILGPYLPESPLGEGIFIAVWNSDEAVPAPEPRLPYGNYYELSRINGVEDGKMKDDIHALTPAQARAIDKKMDDGLPLRGRIVVNGETKWPEDAWGSYAKPGEQSCVALDKNYNTHDFFTSNQPLCHLAVAMECCTRGE